MVTKSKLTYWALGPGPQAGPRQSLAPRRRATVPEVPGPRAPGPAPRARAPGLGPRAPGPGPGAPGPRPWALGPGPRASGLGPWALAPQAPRAPGPGPWGDDDNQFCHLARMDCYVNVLLSCRCADISACSAFQNNGLNTCCGILTFM